jgi:hypothetical protein
MIADQVLSVMEIDASEYGRALKYEGIFTIHTKKYDVHALERLVKSGFIKEVMKEWYIP